MRRFTVEQYHQMVRVGILTTDDHVELLEGFITQKPAKNPQHRLTVGLVRDVLARIIPPGWYVDSQEPITTLDSEPEPDAVVIRGQTRDYPDRHPGPNDIALVVEVADASLERDRDFKKRLYARAAIPVYWIINLVELQIEVYTDPSGPTEQPDYRQQWMHGTTGEVVLVIDGVEVARVSVRELLP